MTSGNGSVKRGVFGRGGSYFFGEGIKNFFEEGGGFFREKLAMTTETSLPVSPGSKGETR